MFHEDWENEKSVKLNNFLQSSKEAKQLMLKSDEIWEKVRPFMQASDDTLFINLRNAYREGIPRDDFSQSQ